MTVVISTDNLSKKYQLGSSQTIAHRVKNMVVGWSKGERFRTHQRPDLWALRDVSFDVEQGEVLGVIGANGAGKTTLLKILSNITDPTYGEATIRGSVRTLLEVGTGFHPELTGRENTYLNGVILGMKTSEIDRRYDQIIEFAGLEEFMETPVKRYSTGMATRLAFSVAAHLEPDILLVDEVLAVGDIGFQKKCLGKMSEVAKSGRTILLVSHNMTAIANMCDRVLVLNSGVMDLMGTATEGVARLQEIMEQLDSVAATELEDDIGSPMTISGLVIDSNDGSGVKSDEPFKVRFSFRLREQLVSMRLMFLIRGPGDQLIVRDVTDRSTTPELSRPGLYDVEITFPPLWLSGGVYHCYVRGIGETPGKRIRARSRDIQLPVRDNGEVDYGMETVLNPESSWNFRHVS